MKCSQMHYNPQYLHSETEKGPLEDAGENDKIKNIWALAIHQALYTSSHFFNLQSNPVPWAVLSPLYTKKESGAQKSGIT